MDSNIFTEVWAWITANLSLLALGLSGLLYFFFERERFVQLVTTAFVAAEKAAREGILEGGPEKMRAAVQSVVDLLPVQAKSVLKVIAGLTGRSLEEFVADLAQAIYDRTVEPVVQDVTTKG